MRNAHHPKSAPALRTKGLVPAKVATCAMEGAGQGYWDARLSASLFADRIVISSLLTRDGMRITLVPAAMGRR